MCFLYFPVRFYLNVSFLMRKCRYTERATSFFKNVVCNIRNMKEKLCSVLHRTLIINLIPRSLFFQNFFIPPSLQHDIYKSMPGYRTSFTQLRSRLFCLTFLKLIKMYNYHVFQSGPCTGAFKCNFTKTVLFQNWDNTPTRLKI